LALEDLIITGGDSIVVDRNSGQCTGIDLCGCWRKGQAGRESRHRGTARAADTTATSTTLVMMMMVVVVLFLVVSAIVFIESPAPGSGVQTCEVEQRSGSSIQAQLHQSAPVEHTYLLTAPDNGTRFQDNISNIVLAIPEGSFSIVPPTE
jgi:hypothetical protein